MNKALKLAANDYQETAKKVKIEHENEIRKRDCKIRETETKDAFLTEENVCWFFEARINHYIYLLLLFFF